MAANAIALKDEFFTWRPQEARQKSQVQTQASNCGATALINVLTALNVPSPDVRTVNHAVNTNARKQSVSVSKYLAARSVAGCTAEDIISGCRTVAGNYIECRFFDFYPRRQVDLQRWLAGWLSMGCSAIATLNMQKVADADYWHHQMIFGVDSAGVHMTNGPDCLSFEDMHLGLNSSSVLQVAKDDVLSCAPFDAEDCNELGEEWSEMDVTKQLLRMKKGYSRKDHILIPAAYRAGITIFARKGTPAAAHLRTATELPLRRGINKDTVAERLTSPLARLLDLPGEVSQQAQQALTSAWLSFPKQSARCRGA